MEFDLKVWRTFYNQVDEISKYLDLCRENNLPIEPIELEKLKDEQQTLIEKSDNYLDQCRIMPKKPLWHYNAEDPATWISDERFNYRSRLR